MMIAAPIAKCRGLGRAIAAARGASRVKRAVSCGGIVIPG
jgi:hypothetical protein